MIKKSMKVEGLLNETDLASLLESLGFLVEGDAQEMLAQDGLKVLKLSVRQQYGQIYTKLKIQRSAKAPEADAPEEADRSVCAVPEEKPLKYSKLKKRMRASFRAVTVNLVRDQMPPAEAVEAFLADSERMTCHPGHGDEFYEDYVRVHGEFAAAWKAGDLEAMKAAAQALRDRKRQCHAKYA